MSNKNPKEDINKLPQQQPKPPVIPQQQPIQLVLTQEDLNSFVITLERVAANPFLKEAAFNHLNSILKPWVAPKAK